MIIVSFQRTDFLGDWDGGKDVRMYLKGSKWSMNRRRQHFNWFRIILLCLLIAAGLYLDKYVIPATPSMFEATPTATRPPEAYLTDAQTLFDQGKLLQSIQAYDDAIAVKPNDPCHLCGAGSRCRSLPETIKMHRPAQRMPCS